MLGSDAFKLQGIGQLFVNQKLLEQSHIIKFYKQATAEKISFIQLLIKKNILPALQIAQTIAHGFGVPIIDIDCLNHKSLPLSLVNEELIRLHMMLPLFVRGTQLYLATDDPTKHTALKEIQFQTGLITQPIVVEADKLVALIEHLFDLSKKQNLSEYDDCLRDIQKEVEIDALDVQSIDDAPLVKFVNKILFDAIKLEASDIHFEIFDKEYRIRYRQDGMLHEVATPPGALSARIAARIKIMSQLNIAERRIPQDGAFKIDTANGRTIDFRVSTCPTMQGEKVVIRILDPDTTSLEIGALGFSPIQKDHFIRAIKRPQGMILVTGPTGSGKTVSMYAALNLLNTKEVNISTVEDPVEISVSGINQVPINTKIGLTFSNVLRSFLRQDPDIIMVGEIRDLETAEIAVKAAQTGHLVLSTLHTNSAVETLNRLVNMGIPSFNIISSVVLIIAQRLARKLCEQCKELRDDLPADVLMDLGFNEIDVKKIKFYNAIGCGHCLNGYKGRIGLFEVLPMTQSLKELILSGANSLDILKKARSEGMITIYQAGLEKIKQGLTTIEELNRVTVD